MERCYPTGCPPCDGPIDFPENPSDGRRYCIPIGSEGNTKCWVWDACVPAWRAEGPSESSTRFRGSLDITQSEAANGITRDTPQDQWQGNPPQPPVTDVAPGDWWILTADVAANLVHPDFDDNLAGDDYSIGDRIFYDGEAYERLAPPIVPYAEEAVDINPLPDNRVGGITLNASLQDALAGTKKCDAITPYTLSNYVQQEIGKLPTVNDGQLTIQQGGSTLETFTANSAANKTVNIPEPGNGRIRLQTQNATIGQFTVNQSGDTDIELPAGFVTSRVAFSHVVTLTGTRQYTNAIPQDTWWTVPLNQKVDNGGNFGTVSNGTVTLPAGTYSFTAIASVHTGGSMVARLVAAGQTFYGNSDTDGDNPGITMKSEVSGSVTSNSTFNVQLQVFVENNSFEYWDGPDSAGAIPIQLNQLFVLKED